MSSVFDKIADTEARGGVRFEPDLNAVVRMDALEQHLPRTGTWTSREAERCWCIHEEQTLPSLLPEPVDIISYYTIPYQLSLSLPPIILEYNGWIELFRR